MAKKVLSVIGGGVVIAATYVMNRLQFSISVVPIITGVLFLAYAILCFCGSGAEKVIWGCIASLIFVTSNYMVTAVIALITPKSCANILMPSEIRLEAMLLYVFANMIIFLILYNINGKKHSLPIFQLILMITLIVAVVAAMSILIRYSLLLAAQGISITFLATVSTIILVISAGIAYFLQHRSSISAKRRCAHATAAV